MNLCTSCNLGFASVAAFDRHRIGKHEYTYSQGLKLDPSREDGRRCMYEDEMIEAGMECDTRAAGALAALNGWRAHRYGSGASANSGPRSGTSS